MEPWRVRTTVPRTHHNVPHSCLAFSRDRSPPGIYVSSASCLRSSFPERTRNGDERKPRISQRKFNQPPSSIGIWSLDSRATNRFDPSKRAFLSFLPSRFDGISWSSEDTGGYRKRRGSSDGFEEDLERMKRLVGMKTSASRSWLDEVLMSYLERVYSYSGGFFGYFFRFFSSSIVMWSLRWIITIITLTLICVRSRNVWLLHSVWLAWYTDKIETDLHSLNQAQASKNRTTYLQRTLVPSSTMTRRNIVPCSSLKSVGAEISVKEKERGRKARKCVHQWQRCQLHALVADSQSLEAASMCARGQGLLARTRAHASYNVECRKRRAEGMGAD